MIFKGIRIFSKLHQLFFDGRNITEIKEISDDVEEAHKTLISTDI
jgi:hypothetical protein